MRWIAAFVVVGCAVPVRPIDVTTTATNAGDQTMSADEFATVTSRLRATLARNSIALDTGTEITNCTGSHLHGRCITCRLAGPGDTAGVAPAMVDEIALAFAMYPDASLAKVDIAHVALCSTIRYSDDDTGPGGVAILNEARMLLSIEPFHRERDGYTIAQVVHHELFHLLDASARSSAPADREWTGLNVASFAYRDPADMSARPAGFVNGYATTNDDEDRASTFEYVMGQPHKLCELAKTDRVLASKARIVWERAALVVGDAVLRRAALCVDAMRSKPSAGERRGPTGRNKSRARPAATPRAAPDRLRLTPR